MVRAGLRAVFVRKRGRYEAIDGIRGLATVWVIFYHVLFAWGAEVTREEYERVILAKWNWIWTKAFLSINPFFILSGFLIGDMLLSSLETRGSLDFRAFYLRRYMRLAPAYYLVLLALVVFRWPEPWPYSLQHLWANPLYINNWFSFRDQPAAWSWSLAVEEQFYLVCPLLVLGLSKKRAAAPAFLLLLIGASILFTYHRARTVGPFRLVYHWTHDPDAFFKFFDRSYTQTMTRLAVLVMGVGCAYLKRSTKFMSWAGSKGGRRVLLSVFAILSLGILNPWVTPKAGGLTPPLMTALLNPIFAFGCACLMIFTLADPSSARRTTQFLGSRLLFPFAQLSYGLYLFHEPITAAFFRHYPGGPVIDPAHLVARGALVLAITFVPALALSVFVETPARKLAERLTKGARA